ncbi:MAG: hypothetical protein ACP5KZ_09325, partial [bacterium]
TQLCPGSYSFTWDGTMNKVGMPPPTTAPRGLYTFNIIVQGACPYDMDQMRSQSLKITDHELNALPPDDCQARYKLSDTKPASSAGVKLYALTPDKGYDKVWEATDGTALTPTWNEVIIPGSVLDPLEEYRPVFWAIDDHIETDKAHRRKPALEVNVNPCLGTAVDFGISNLSEDMAETAAKEQDNVFYFRPGKSGQVVVLTRKLGRDWEVKLPYIKVANPKEELTQGYYVGIWYKPFQNKQERPLKKKQIDRPASWVWYALGWDPQIGYIGSSRVNVFSWAVHGSFSPPTVWFADNTSITADQISSSNLNFRNLRCAILLNCTHDELEEPTSEESKKMFDAFSAKGAHFVGGIRGGPIYTTEASKFAQVFWKLATKGEKIGDGYYLVPLYSAVIEAFSAAYPYLNPIDGGPVLRRGRGIEGTLGGWIQAVTLGSQTSLLY